MTHVAALPGNPYDGHTLATVIPAMEDMIGNTIERLLADAGYRGHNAVGVEWRQSYARVGKLASHYLGHRNLQSTARYTALAVGRFKGFGRIRGRLVWPLCNRAGQTPRW